VGADSLESRGNYIMTLHPFKVAIPQADLDTLYTRLQQTRWPDEADGSEWMMGASLHYMKELIDYWQHAYDWRLHEVQMNALPQFTTLIEGTRLHFVHVKSQNPQAVPLLLVHGWPDSFYRFHKIIPLLTDAFDLIVPSIPGFGFSDRKTLTSAAVAKLIATLMADTLGYKDFMACGGDVGGGIVKTLAARYPNLVKAIYLTDVGYPNGSEDRATMTEAEQEFSNTTRRWVMTQGAYLMLQQSKPQTLAYALNDSPVALAAWIVSMIQSQAEDNKIDEAFGGRDALLTNIMIYWLTETAGSAARIYTLNGQAMSSQPEPKSIVPAGIALFPREIPFPQEWAERTLNVQHYEKMPRGGHFAALEEPTLFAGKLREFFTRFRVSSFA
jgi:pimeloyl-ACP methyl ester carboxylesterase